MSQKHIVIDARGRESSSGRYVDRLLEHLQRIDTDNRYTVLLAEGDDWQPEAANFAATVCHYRKFSFNPLDQWTFAKFLDGLRPDLVHFWMTPQEPAFYRGKRVTTTHDLTMFKYARAGRLPLLLHWLRMVGYRMLFKTSIKKAEYVITPTEYVKQDLIKHYPFARDKVSVTLEASEPPLPGDEQKPNIELERFLLYVGSAFPHKNLESLVDAFGLLHAKDPSLHLVLVGKKEFYYEQLEKFVATKPYARNIHHTGFVSDQKLKWLYKHAEAYVFPSLSEGFGLPGLEAMVHGCPVVSSNATCLPEVYGDAAEYFDPSSVEDMAKKIELVVGDYQLRKELTEKGSKQAGKYSWRRMAEETRAIYEKVLSQ